MIKITRPFVYVVFLVFSVACNSTQQTDQSVPTYMIPSASTVSIMSDDVFESIRRRPDNILTLDDLAALESMRMSENQIDTLFDDLENDYVKRGFRVVNIFAVSQTSDEIVIPRMLELAKHEDPQVRAFVMAYFLFLARTRQQKGDDIPRVCDIISVLENSLEDGSMTIMGTSVSKLADESLTQYKDTVDYSNCHAN